MSIRRFAHDRPVLVRWLLWILAVVFTLGAFTWQDKTGPTYPLEGEIDTARGPVRFMFVRSETVSTPLPVLLVDPVPEGIKGQIQYRRFRSHDAWTVVPLERKEFRFERRGRATAVTGLGVALPGLPERAGKYEMLMSVDDGSGRLISVTGDRPVYARFKGAVPGWALITHIFIIFASMIVAMRTVLEAMIDGDYRRLLLVTIASFLLGAFLLGPIVQWYAFGVWWSGVPFGYDWTDNKVLVSLVAWLLAWWANRGGRRSRGWIYAAGVVTLLVYFIPHSVFGSEFDYRTGKGHGTAG